MYESIRNELRKNANSKMCLDWIYGTAGSRILVTKSKENRIAGPSECTAVGRAGYWTADCGCWQSGATMVPSRFSPTSPTRSPLRRSERRRMTTMNKQFVLYAPLLNVERLDGVRSLDLFSIKIYQPTSNVVLKYTFMSKTTFPFLCSNSMCENGQNSWSYSSKTFPMLENNIHRI